MPDKIDVLIVDDEPALRGLLRSILEDDGYSVTEAADGPAALRQLAERTRPMVVLLDQRMPGMTGTEMLQALAQDARASQEFACILLTGAGDRQSPMMQVPGLCLPVPVLDKPFDIDTLLDAVAYAAATVTALCPSGRSL